MYPDGEHTIQIHFFVWEQKVSVDKRQKDREDIMIVVFLLRV